MTVWLSCWYALFWYVWEEKRGETLAKYWLAGFSKTRYERLSKLYLFITEPDVHEFRVRSYVLLPPHSCAGSINTATYIFVFFSPSPSPPFQGLAKRTRARILLASTSEIYGDPLEHPQKEDYWGNVNPIGVRSCYDEGKSYRAGDGKKWWFHFCCTCHCFGWSVVLILLKYKLQENA